MASATLITPLPMVAALGSPIPEYMLRVITLPVPAPTSELAKAEPRAPDEALAAPAMA